MWNLFNQRYTCDQCGRSYKHKSNLCNHKREECGKPPSYFCPVCKKGFKKKQHLQRHLTVHSDVDLSGYNIDKDILKSLIPQNIGKNQDFKTSVTPTGLIPEKVDLPVNSTPCLPPVSIFPNQFFPYPPAMYPNPLIRPLMHPNNFPPGQIQVPSSGVKTLNSSQDCMLPGSQQSDHVRESIAASDSNKDYPP